MDIELVKSLLPCMGKNTFLKFIYELWSIESGLVLNEVRELREVGNNIYEQEYYEKKLDVKWHGYNLIVPFFIPIELFVQNQDVSFIDENIIIALKKYKRLIKSRESSWQFWMDGNYAKPNIYFVTNFEGIEEDMYYSHILPKFEQLLRKINLEACPMVGSYDSFLSNARDETMQAFKNLVSKNKDELSISLKEDKISIDKFISDKYISKGVLKNSLNPCESIYIDEIYKTNIIKEFETLLNSKTSESAIESFLLKNFKNIFGEQYDRIETQIWLRFPDLDIAQKDRRIDLFLRNSIERDWELFEIKKPQKLTRTYRDIPTFRSEIFYAIQQIKNYERILSQKKVREVFKKEGIEYFYPELRLVIGNKPDIEVEQWRWLKATNENRLKIITYEDLIESMKTRLKIHSNLSY